MDRVVVTPALVARSVDYGEADRICSLLTRDLGRVSALARSARRSRKRFGGALSLFVIGDATLKPSRGDLLALERFDALQDLAPGIGGDVIKVAHGSYMLELARELWPEGQADADAFDLLCDGLRAVADNPPSPPLLRGFELQLLQAMGLAPCLDRCVSCGTAEALAAPGNHGQVVFNLHRGGIVCPACTPSGTALDPAAHELLLGLSRTPLHRCPDAIASAAHARQARDLMLTVVRHQLGKDLKTLDFILKLRGG